MADPRSLGTADFPFTISRLGAPLLRAREAASFWQRLRGLHVLPPLGPNDALILRPCRAVQTFGMERPIDIAFVDAQGVVLKVARLEPGRIALCLGARVAIEMAAGSAARLELAPGHRLALSAGGWT